MCSVEEVSYAWRTGLSWPAGLFDGMVGGRMFCELFLLGGNGWKWYNAARGDVRLMRMSDLVGCRSLEESTRAIR